ncbi:MAG TPA: response regulator [Gemmatimonadales bacterium]|jgi:CheY-like chemotaxis protein
MGEPATPRRRRPVGRPPAETILVVDNEASVRRVVRRVLEHDGQMVLEAEDAESALRLIERHRGPLDLVLTDLTMPGIGGQELAEVLSVFRPDLRVLAMTGFPEHHLPDRRLPLLTKPFTLDTLRDAIRTMRARPRAQLLGGPERRARVIQLRAVLDGEPSTALRTPQSSVDLVAAVVRLRQLEPQR